jgi:alpha-mannosidase
MGGANIVANPTSFDRSEFIENQAKLSELIVLSPYSITNMEMSMEYPGDNCLSASKNQLENNFLRVEFNENGDTIRIFDKMENREVLPQNSLANQFLAFEDIPLGWDAWDIDIYYDDKVWFSDKATSIKVLEDGPIKVALEIKRKILNSGYTQIISLTLNSRRIDFDTQIDWQERQTLLKVSFPVNILAPKATHEIQWGNVERPTHRNTSWDWARFETAAQKWVDLSEGDYGVSLINDCKYGHDIHNNIIRLTLLRGTTAPDPNADLGLHKFKYSLLPHLGGWGQETAREAYFLNDPIIHFSPDRSTQKSKIQSYPDSLPSLVKVDRKNIIIETIKQAEDENGIIVRLYDYQRQRGPFVIETPFEIKEAWKTNMLEENQENIMAKNKKISYSIKPYQIITLRIIPKTNVDFYLAQE